MENKNIIIKFLKLSVRTWLKINCKKININNLDIVINNKLKGRVYELNLEASDLIFKDLFINKIILNFSDFNFKFNHKRNLLISDSSIISCFLEIDNINLKKILFNKKWINLRLNIQKYATESFPIQYLEIGNGLIKFFYKKNTLILESCFLLKLEKNLVFLENIINKQKIFIPMDKEIFFKNCEIFDKVINIDFLAKVTLNN